MKLYTQSDAPFSDRLWVCNETENGPNQVSVLLPPEMAQELVRAVNAHDALVEALKAVKSKMEEHDSPWWIDCPDKGGFDLDQIEAALALAERERP